MALEIGDVEGDEGDGGDGAVDELPEREMRRRIVLIDLIAMLDAKLGVVPSLGVGMIRVFMVWAAIFVRFTCPCHYEFYYPQL